MANILAFDTSSESCSVAVCRTDEPGRVWSENVSGTGQHSRHILELIQSVLAQAALEKHALDAIAVTIGPGSFTGLRVACSIAQGLAYALHKPIIALTSLEVLASQVSQSEWVFASLDARMGEIYWALYQNVEGVPLLKHPISVTAPEKIMCDTFKQQCDASTQLYGIGPGMRYVESLPVALQGILTHVAPDVMPDAVSMLTLAQRKFDNQHFTVPLALEPLYVRDEVTWKKYQPSLIITQTGVQASQPDVAQKN